MARLDPRAIAELRELMGEDFDTLIDAFQADSQAQIDAIAEELAEADRTHGVIPRITARYPEAAIEDSYAIQGVWRDRMVASGRPWAWAAAARAGTCWPTGSSITLGFSIAAPSLPTKPSACCTFCMAARVSGVGSERTVQWMVNGAVAISLGGGVFGRQGVGRQGVGGDGLLLDDGRGVHDGVGGGVFSVFFFVLCFEKVAAAGPRRVRRGAAPARARRSRRGACAAEEPVGRLGLAGRRRRTRRQE